MDRDGVKNLYTEIAQDKEVEPQYRIAAANQLKQMLQEDKYAEDLSAGLVNEFGERIAPPVESEPSDLAERVEELEQQMTELLSHLSVPG